MTSALLPCQEEERIHSRQHFLTGSHASVFGTSVSLLCLLSIFICCSLPLCPGSSYRGRPQLHHSIRKAKMAGKLLPGGGRGDEKEKYRLPVVLWVGGTAAEVLQHLAVMCQSENPSRLMQSRCMYHHPLPLRTF